jgi:hypothetical protein
VLADHPMEPGTPGLGDLIVQNLAVESVTEPIAGAEHPVRPLGRATTLDDATSPCQRLEPRLQALHFLLEVGRRSPGRQDGSVELDAHDARPLEGPALFGGQRFEPALDERAQPLRHLAQRGGRVFHDPAVVELADHLRVHQVVEHVDHEERIAPAALKDLIRHALRVRAIETSGRVRPHVASGQELDVQVLAHPPSPELVNRLEQDRVAHRRLRRAIGAQDQQPRGLGTLGDRGQQVHRGHVAPMEVLQHQHERRLFGQALEHVVQLANHPLPRGALDPLPQPLELRFLDHGG